MLGLGGGGAGQVALPGGLPGRWGAYFSRFLLTSVFPLSVSCPRVLQQIMKDKWINIGYEGEELKPYTEPEEDFGDTKRIGEGQGQQVPQLLRATGHRARGGSFPAPALPVSA